MTGSRLPVSTRQSAWSSSKENIGQFDGDNITKPDKHDQKTSPVRPVSHSARHRQPTQNYPVPGHLSPRKTTTELHAEPAPKPSVKQTAEQAAKMRHDAPSQAAAPRVEIVSSAQPAQRTRTGFQPNSQYPMSYIGMPANTTGITIGPPEERK